MVAEDLRSRESVSAELRITTVTKNGTKFAHVQLHHAYYRAEFIKVLCFIGALCEGKDLNVKMACTKASLSATGARSKRFLGTYSTASVPAGMCRRLVSVLCKSEKGNGARSFWTRKGKYLKFAKW